MYAHCVLGFLVMCIYIYIYIYVFFNFFLSIFRTMSLGPLFHGFVGRTRIIARCFWALIGFMILYLPVFMTIHVLVMFKFVCTLYLA